VKLTGIAFSSFMDCPSAMQKSPRPDIQEGSYTNAFDYATSLQLDFHNLDEDSLYFNQ
jgi:hypothetical protein